jgi:hypothetical protein
VLAVEFSGLLQYLHGFRLAPGLEQQRRHRHQWPWTLRKRSCSLFELRERIVCAPCLVQPLRLPEKCASIISWVRARC